MAIELRGGGGKGFFRFLMIFVLYRKHFCRRVLGSMKTCRGEQLFFLPFLVSGGVSGEGGMSLFVSTFCRRGTREGGKGTWWLFFFFFFPATTVLFEGLGTTSFPG